MTTRVGLVWVFVAVLFAAPILSEEKSVVLFDFERGIEDWSGNAWGGGGKCIADKAAEAKFGVGALHGSYTDVQKGANVIGPSLPEDAAWRRQSWSAVTFWLKGDGSPGRLNVHLVTDQPGTGFTANVPLESKEWTRFKLPLTRFWSREALRPDLSKLKRIFFGGRKNYSFDLDQVALHATHREIPFDEEKAVVCPKCSNPPLLDGNLNDECWKSAATLSEFVTYDYGKSAKDPTRVMLCWDEQRLYLAADMKMSDPRKLKASLTRRDADVYAEDCIEFFFDPEDAQKDWYQLDVNPLGTLLDIASKGLKDWNADWQARCRTGEHGWTAEVAIAFSSFGRTPNIGDIWGFNVGREVPSTGEISCWSCTQGKFHNLKRWGHLVFADRLESLPICYELNEYAFGDYGLVCDPTPLAGRGGELLLRITNNQGQVFARKVSLTPEAARQGEVIIPVQAQFAERGEAKFSFVAVSNGNVVSVRTGRFIVFPPAKPKPRPFVSLLPTPKKIVPGRGEFALPRELGFSCTGLEKADRERCIEFLANGLKLWYGVTLREAEPARAALSITQSASLPNSCPDDLAADYKSLPAEGYVLTISQDKVALHAKDARGVFYGLQTFLQAVAVSTTLPSKPIAPAMAVVDYPSLRVRAASMSLPCGRWGYPNDAYVTPEFFCDFLGRTLVRWKYNTLVLIVNNGMKFDRHPECSGPAAWTKEEVRRVLEFCRRHYIEVIPLQTVLAHANWFTLAHKDLWEDGDYHIACVSNPATQQLLREVYEEIIEVFQPKFFHLGMDEAWWKTLDVPPEKRCKLCAGKPKWQIVAEQATRFREFLGAKGIRAMMWGDMLLPEHNGGPPYHSAKALDVLPRDIVICNWSTSLAPSSSKRFRDLGHEVIQSNSTGVNRQQAEWLIGNMMGVWVKNPWLTDTYFRGAQSYSFLSLLQAAELSWNVSDDLSRPTWGLRRDLIEEFAESALRQLALNPEPAAPAQQSSLTLAPLCNLSTAASEPPSRENWFGLSRQEDLRALPPSLTLAGVRLNIAPSAGFNAIALFGKPITIPVNARVASLYFLHGCHLDEKEREVFLKRFQKKEAMTGILLATYVMKYEDGSQEKMEMRYGWNILPWRMREDVMPYCYAAPAVFCLATEGMKQRDPRGVDVQLYLAQWANPNPGKKVISVEFASANTEAIPFLLAVTAKGVRD